MSWWEQKVFNRVLDRSLDKPEVHAERRRTLAGARGRILEVGIGTGLNLPWYPPDVERITAVSRDPGLSPRAELRAEERGIAVEHVPVDAHGLPFPGASFDTIVCTLLLCSVDDPSQVVGEMKRVLAPDGRLLVYEHVVSPRPFERFAQRVIGPFHRLFGCGCRMNRDTATTIAAAGFDCGEIASYKTDALSFPTTQVIRGAARASS